ncbi:related to UPF0652 protein C22H10.08 [Saccharomycodes ludwigii]|uniref:Related to UPF0652 protein C22H10.08 n=1 Tax=Saccharomycodes ludwigii TaxID=36035 RepID=A0A376B3X0_9ASCO|nr:related to UPF0652 protein C22H10.08 [Saccharomycodes ludwigii]
MMNTLGNFKTKRTLKEILDSEYIPNDKDEEFEFEAEDETEKEDINSHDPLLCIECKDMKTEIICKDCEEPFCVVCFDMIHRNGKRKTHDFIKLTLEENQQEKTENINTSSTHTDNITIDNNNSKFGVSDSSDFKDQNSNSIDDQMLNTLIAHSEYIPLRLTYEERHLLRLLEAALQVSEYTDKVDILSYGSKAKKIVAQLKEMCSVLCGLAVASNMKIGAKLIEMKNFSDISSWFQEIFEIGRRYKIMNPDRMRDTYGKLCYMVMDSRLPQIEDHMEFHLYKPIKTVSSYLNFKDPNSLNMFKEKSILYATCHISPVGKSRQEINRLIKQKERAIEYIASKYHSSKIDREEIRQVLYSIGDYNAYIKMNREPITRMIERLKLFAQPEIVSRYSIGIQYGRAGARLTHDHNRQWNYVQQSLTLWSVIQREMIHLWYIADYDLFDGNSYKLASTGQGLNRIKACPQLYKIMHQILHECRSKCDSWVGSSVVHLGDDAVPNALFFLDKYTQVPSILIPFDQTLMKIDDLVGNDKEILDYINKVYGSVDDLKLTILQDAFAHMFDGSGADNFYMSGSCIDGRLTSAWNHTNQISKKKYYNIFLMCGFIGFNGEGY